ncbi:hypothetical protein [Thermococcus camini]|uniref:HEAT repeat domain-containing protein n=1 Tax=Thermococcus camini TaxID=2016373 RepID=A0A7G2D5E0_9EURY|nr:hypothetical protein [Thermococcus camini]CAD5243449.1 conserved protein of unknown function [Thermococcus camini]
MDQIREMLTSWQAMDVINIANDDDHVLMSLLGLLEDDDSTVRLRALMAIGKLLEDSDTGVRTLILSQGFMSLAGRLTDEDPRVVYRALEVLTPLLENTPLDEERFLVLLDAAAQVMAGGDTLTCLSILDLFERVRVPPLGKDGLSKIRSLVFSDSLWTRLLGLRVLLNMGTIAGYWEFLTASMASLISSGNALMIELGIDLLEEVLEFHATPEMMRRLVRFTSLLRAVETGEENVFLRTRAGEVRKDLENVLFSYYTSRHEEALDAVRSLLSDGRGEDALFLLFIIGKTDLLLRMWEENGGIEPDLVEALRPSGSV